MAVCPEDLTIAKACADLVELVGTWLEEVGDTIAATVPTMLQKFAWSLRNLSPAAETEAIKSALGSVSWLLTLPKLKERDLMGGAPVIAYLDEHVSLRQAHIILEEAYAKRDLAKPQEFLDSVKKTAMLLFAKLNATVEQAAPAPELCCAEVRKAALELQEHLEMVASELSRAYLQQIITAMTPVAGGKKNGSWKEGLNPKTATWKQINDVAEKTLFDDSLADALDNGFKASEKDV